MSDSAFVGAMTELRRIQNDASLDSARRKMARDSVLQGRGLTPDRMERAARALAHDPERASALWTEIDRRLLAPQTTTAPALPRPTGRPTSPNGRL